MKKMLKEILISPIFLVCLVLSIVGMAIFYFSYTNTSSSDNNHSYNIVYSADASKYDEDIELYKEQMERLDPKDRDYDYDKKWIEQHIMIYEELKVNNVYYSKVYDYGPGNIADRSIYQIKSFNIISILTIINLLVILYLVFTREFDNGMKVFIYGHTRYKEIIKKITISFGLTLGVYLLLFLLNLVFSLNFKQRLDYVLIVDDKAYIEQISTYVFKNIFLFSIYCISFIFFVIFAISLFTRKTVFTLLAFIGLCGLVFVLQLFNLPLVVFMGLVNQPEIISYSYYPLTRLSIIIPILGTIYGIYHFEHCDIK